MAGRVGLGKSHKCWVACRNADGGGTADMRKYGGVVVHCVRDAQGLVEVVDAHGVRSLHFGSSPKQSAMALAEPERLELSYVRAMLAGLMFAPDPRRVLLLGLGGGSLAKFLLEHFPECRVEVVESRAAVVEAARRFFGLPEDPRLVIHIADGVEFVRRAAREGALPYEHVFVDIYDDRGLVPAVNEAGFFAAGAGLVAPGGVFALNLWGSQQESFRESVALLRRHFDNRALRLPVIGRGNIIGLGLGTALARSDQELLKKRSRALEMRLGVEFPRLLKSLAPFGWR